MTVAKGRLRRQVRGRKQERKFLITLAIITLALIVILFLVYG